MAFFEGCPVPLIPGEGRVGLAGQAGWVPTRTGLVDGGSGRRGKGSGGGARASVQKRSKFLTRTKRRKMAFFEGCGVGGVPTGAGLVDGGVDQGPWLQERVGGRRGDGKFRNVWLRPELWTGGQGGGARARGGVQGLRFRGDKW